MTPETKLHESTLALLGLQAGQDNKAEAASLFNTLVSLAGEIGRAVQYCKNQPLASDSDRVEVGASPPRTPEDKQAPASGEGEDVGSRRQQPEVFHFAADDRDASGDYPFNGSSVFIDFLDGRWAMTVERPGQRSSNIANAVEKHPYRELACFGAVLQTFVHGRGPGVAS